MEEIIFSAIKCALGLSKAVHVPKDADWEALYAIAKNHDICSIVFSGFEKSQINIPDNIMELFENMKNLDIAKDIAQTFEAETLLDLFNKNHVACMPLKGYFMKELYPETYLRTRCDTDILIRSDCVEKAVDIMNRQSYAIREESEHEIVYKRPPFISIELHKLLLKRSSSEKLYQYYKDIWKRLTKSDSYIYKMTNEDFYIYMIVHIAKHYKNGGTGIRSILDIYLFNRKFKDNLNLSYLRGELEKLELWDFTKNIELLSLCWFEEREYSDMISAMSRYIIRGSTYGNLHFVSAAKVLSLKGDNLFSKKIKRFIQVSFPSYENMTFLYPSLRGKAPLLPFYWIWRFVDKVLLKKKNIKDLNLQTNSDNLNYLKNHFEDIGLDL